LSKILSEVDGFAKRTKETSRERRGHGYYGLTYFIRKRAVGGEKTKENLSIPLRPDSDARNPIKRSY